MGTKLSVIILASLLLAAGCSTAHRGGIVGWGSGMPIGSVAKDIPFTASDGTKTTFDKVRSPIAIVAFTSTPPEQCCWTSPQLLNLTNRFEDLPISIAQISLPTTKCTHGPGCAEMCQLGKTRLFSLCDTDRIAWNAYNEPKPGTVILIDQSDKIVATGSLDNLKPVADKAYEMGKRLHESEPDMIYRNMYFR